MAKASDNAFPSVLLVEQGSAPATPASGQARLYRGTDNALKMVDDAGVVASIGGGGFKDFAQATRASTDLTVNSATFVNVDTALDLSMTAATGDVIEVGMSAAVVGSASAYVVFDFHTIVSASPVNSVTTGSAASTTVAYSFPGWARAKTQGSLDLEGGSNFYGAKRYTLQSGDISGGTVTLRLRAFSGASVTVKAGSATSVLYVWANNLGPQI